MFRAKQTDAIKKNSTSLYHILRMGVSWNHILGVLVLLLLFCCCLFVCYFVFKLIISPKSNLILWFPVVALYLLGPNQAGRERRMWLSELSDRSAGSYFWPSGAGHLFWKSNSFLKFVCLTFANYKELSCMQALKTNKHTHTHTHTRTHARTHACTHAHTHTVHTRKQLHKGLNVMYETWCGRFLTDRLRSDTEFENFCDLRQQNGVPSLHALLFLPVSTILVAVVAVVLVVLVVSLGVPRAGRFLSCSKIVHAYADMTVLLRVCVHVVCAEFWQYVFVKNV